MFLNNQRALPSGDAPPLAKKKDFARTILTLCRTRWFLLFNVLVVAVAVAHVAWRRGADYRSLQLLNAILAGEGLVISLSLLWASVGSAGKVGRAGMESEGKAGRATEPLQMLSSAQAVCDRVTVATSSVVGHRKQNEDACGAYTFPLEGSEASLLIVCDGVGGEAHGERASRETVKLASALIPKLVELGKNVRDGDVLTRVVHEHFKEAAAALGEIAERESLSGLTTTLVAAFAYEDFLAYWWAGDSRAYILRRNRLRLLSRDHSVPVERYNVDPHEVANHEEKSQITRVLQPGVAALPDIGFETLEAGDVVILCSDGVWESCTYGELQGIFNYFLVADLPLDQVCLNVLNVLSINTSDNSTIAMHRRNGPAPSSHTLLSPGVLLTKGLREEFVAMIYETSGEMPAGDFTHIVKARPSPPATLTARYANSKSTGGVQSWDEGATDDAHPRLCIHCGKMMTSDTACCDAPDLHAGFYLLLTDAGGRVRYHRVSSPEATLVGRSAGSEGIDIDDPQVAARHLKIEVKKDGEVLFKDLDSDNGTFLSLSSHRLLVTDLERTVLQLGATRIQLLHTSFLEGGGEAGEPSHS